MKTRWQDLWLDSHGFIVSAELVWSLRILVIGMLVGLVSVRDQVVQEVRDVAAGMSKTAQSYQFAGITGHSASTGGSVFDRSGRLLRPAGSRPAIPDLCVSVTCRPPLPNRRGNGRRIGMHRPAAEVNARTPQTQKEPLVAVPSFADRGRLASDRKSAGLLGETRISSKGSSQSPTDDRTSSNRCSGSSTRFRGVAGSRAKSSSAASHTAGCSASRAVRPASAREFPPPPAAGADPP